jgi:hypothetical protein
MCHSSPTIFRQLPGGVSTRRKKMTLDGGQFNFFGKTTRSYYGNWIFFLDVHSKFILRKETIWIMFNVSVLLSYEIAELFNFKMMAADC